MSKNKTVFLASLLILTSCGKKAGNDNQVVARALPELQSIESQRINDIESMTSEEVSKQSEFPLTTKEGTLNFLNVISTKLENGSKVSELSAHIWLLLESIHQNWSPDDKTVIKSKLETLASSNEEIAGMIEIFLASEGLTTNDKKIFDEIEATDSNHKLILARKNILTAKALLSSEKGLPYWIPTSAESASIAKAAQALIYQNLKTQSLGQPIEYSNLVTDWSLPFVNWSGSIYSEWANTWNISSQQVNGTRFGGTKDWSGAGSDGHAFITPNMSSQNHGDRIDYNLSLVSEIKGGTKKHGDKGTSNKHSHASFNLKGKVTIPQCIDLSNCSPFVVLKVNNFQIVNGASAQIKINGSAFNIKQEQLINRTQGPTEIEISTSASRIHSGKSGAIHDTLAIGLSIIQDSDFQASSLDIKTLVNNQASSYLNVNKWAKSFEAGLIDRLRSDDSGTFIFRHIKYLDEISKDTELDVNQLSAIKVLYRFIVQESMIRHAPIVHKLISEKRKSILRLPTTEIASILSESMKMDLSSEKARVGHENIKHSLSKIEDEQLKGMNITDEQFEIASKKNYLMVTLYKNLNDKMTTIAMELEQDIEQLEAELAQLQHMIQKPEGMDTHEIH